MLVMARLGKADHPPPDFTAGSQPPSHNNCPKYALAQSARRKDHCGVDLLSDALPFGRLWLRHAISCNRLRNIPQPFTRCTAQHFNTQTAPSEYTAAIDETLVSLKGFC